MDRLEAIDKFCGKFLDIMIPITKISVVIWSIIFLWRMI